jgi:hypothetical protein
MKIRIAILSMTSAVALLACRGEELPIGGEPEGGPGNPNNGPGASEAGSTVIIADAGPTNPTPTNPVATSPTPTSPTPTSPTPTVQDGGALIVLDASVGGLCSSVDAGSPDYDESYCGCTRRPGPGASFFNCPPGIGNNASVVLDPSSVTATTLSLQGRQGVASGVPARIDFAPGSVQTPTEVTLIETSIPPPADFMDWSPIYAVEPLGLAITNGARLQLPWTNAPDATGITTIPSGMAIWFSADGSCFTRLPDSLGNAGFNTGSLSQLGYLMVGVPRNASTATCP